MKCKKVVSLILAALLAGSSLTALAAPTDGGGREGRNLEQKEIPVISNMPNLPKEGNVIDWKSRGLALDDFLFDWDWKSTPGRKFATIFEDEKYGGFMMPAFYGETRPVEDLDKQEAITLMGALLQGSLLGNRKDVPNPKDKDGGTYLDAALKFFWTEDGVFTNFPDGAKGTSAYNDFWYLLIANQNFFRLAALYPDWDVKDVQKTVADKLCEMMEILGGGDAQKADFNKQAFNFSTMTAVNPGWRQPDAAAGTANIRYYAYKIFGTEKYLTYAKYCMDYLDSLTENPYYENMLIDASYIATMMNAALGTNYDASKYIAWITGKNSAVRNWGGVNYSQDGRDVYGLTGEANGDRQYAFFFNSIYPMTSILPTAKYDPSYAKAAGKWALNIASSARYFLPSEWDGKNQSNPEFKGQI